MTKNLPVSFLQNRSRFRPQSQSLASPQNQPISSPQNQRFSTPLGTPDLFEKCDRFSRDNELRNAGFSPYFVPIEGTSGTEVVVDGERKLMFGSNNYLGLTHDPAVLARAAESANEYGTGCTGSRLLNGTLDLHEQLEAELADFIGKESALVFSTGYQTNLGVISTLLERGDSVVLDKLDHASLLDGARLSAATSFRYNHGDVDHLDAVLDRATRENPTGGKLVVVDGIFSMEGDLADLPALIEICEKHQARLYVDEAHAIGVMGKTGAGVHEHFGVTDRCDLIAGTFSKSFASIGGFVAGDRSVLDYIKYHARPFIFSASMPAYSIATVRESLRIVRTEPERRAKLWRNKERFHLGLAALGFDTGATKAPILPVYVGDLGATFALWRELLKGGVFTNPVVPPAVPERTCRIRTSVMATHSDEQIDRALEVFQAAGKSLGLI